MANIQITVDTGYRKFISNSVPGHGSTPDNYDITAALTAQRDPANFPGFTGTPAEWQIIVDSASVKIVNLGKN